jgi:hypothetical protein
MLDVDTVEGAVFNTVRCFGADVKICRGDVWEFEAWVGHIKYLADAIYTPGSPGVAPDSMPFSL